MIACLTFMIIVYCTCLSVECCARCLSIVHDGKSCQKERVMGNLALGLGWGAEADEGYFRNKFYISAANTTKGKMIDWI